MEYYKISILFSILKDFIKTGRISVLENLRNTIPKKLILILIDSLGLKEFNFLQKNIQFFSRYEAITLINPFPSTKIAYKQIFFQGKVSIFDFLRESPKILAAIDNRAELSLFPAVSNVVKFHRRDDNLALLKAQELLKNSDIVWLHIMSLDHLYHSGVKSANKFLLEFGEKLISFVKSLEHETLCIIFGDHGKHYVKSTHYNKSKKEKKEFYRELSKIRFEAKKTVLCPIFV